MTEERHRAWDVTIKVLGAVAVVISFFVGLHHYNDEKEKEFKKPLWEKQLAFYLDATKSAATLASFQNEEAGEAHDEWERANVRFWQLYYGEMVVVEDKDVSQAMVEFGNCLREYKLEHCDQRKLMTHALALAQVCRDSVGKSWREPLGEIKREIE